MTAAGQRAQPLTQPLTTSNVGNEVSEPSGWYVPGELKYADDLDSRQQEWPGCFGRGTRLGCVRAYGAKLGLSRSSRTVRNAPGSSMYRGAWFTRNPTQECCAEGAFRHWRRCVWRDCCAKLPSTWQVESLVPIGSKMRAWQESAWAGSCVHRALPHAYRVTGWPIDWRLVHLMTRGRESVFELMPRPRSQKRGFGSWCRCRPRGG